MAGKTAFDMVREQVGKDATRAREDLRSKLTFIQRQVTHALADMDRSLTYVPSVGWANTAFDAAALAAKLDYLVEQERDLKNLADMEAAFAAHAKLDAFVAEKAKVEGCAELTCVLDIAGDTAGWAANFGEGLTAQTIAAWAEARARAAKAPHKKAVR